MSRLRSFCHFLQCIFKPSFTFHLFTAFLVLPFFLSEASGGLKKVEKAKTLTLIEYFDFSCPLSAQSSKSLNSFKDKIGSHVSIIRRSLAFSERFITIVIRGLLRYTGTCQVVKETLTWCGP